MHHSTLSIFFFPTAGFHVTIAIHTYFSKKGGRNLDRFDEENRRVQYYSDGRFHDGERFDDRYSSYINAGRRRGLPSWAKAVIIIVLILVAIAVFTAGCSSIIGGIAGDSDSSQVTTNFGHDYIGVLYVIDTIDEYGSGSYNHQYLLNAINSMAEDDRNKGIILYVDTPGGSVYASDELYLKIRDYQETTGRPVYSSMQSQATSGGYYISAPCDKIIANRNCWTGSIGVTMGTFIDISGLLSDLGIKTETITSGANKAMGSSTEPMTDEQRAIFQSVIDEAYEQFVSIVAEGRGMSEDQVRELADGRIYSAQQAVDNGLVDEIGTFEEAVNDMAAVYGMEDVYVEYFRSKSYASLSDLLGIIADQKGSSSVTDAEAIEALIELNGSFRLSYMSNVSK